MMRIGWATSLNDQSGISRYSRQICEELTRRGASVEILRVGDDPATELPTVEGASVVRALASFDAEFLASRYDLCVANIGSDRHPHRHTLEVIMRAPCVTVFHGASISSFATEPHLSERSNHLDGKPPGQESRGDDARLDFEGIGLLASLSTGAIGHDRHLMETLKRSCPGPVVEIPLFFPRGGELGHDSADRESAKEKGDPTRPSIESYVDALIPVLDNALCWAPLRNAGRTIGATVAEMGLSSNDPLATRLASEFSALFHGYKRISEQ